MSKRKDRREELAKRVEEARRKRLEQRKKIAAEAPRLTKQMLEGAKYSEDVVVKLKDGRWAKVEVHALSEKDMLEVLRKKGRELRFDREITIDDYDMFLDIAEKATPPEFTREVLAKGLAFGESAVIATKALELSGVGREEEIRTFREEE